jgi:hypothetical protein
MDTDTDRLGGDDCEHNHGARNSIGFVSSVSGFQSTGSLSQPNRGGQRGEVILRSRCRNSARVLLLHVRSCMVVPVHVRKKSQSKKAQCQRFDQCMHVLVFFPAWSCGPVCLWGDPSHVQLSAYCNENQRGSEIRNRGSARQSRCHAAHTQ